MRQIHRPSPRERIQVSWICNAEKWDTNADDTSHWCGIDEMEVDPKSCVIKRYHLNLKISSTVWMRRHSVRR